MNVNWNVYSITAISQYSVTDVVADKHKYRAAMELVWYSIMMPIGTATSVRDGGELRRPLHAVAVWHATYNAKKII